METFEFLYTPEIPENLEVDNECHIIGAAMPTQHLRRVFVIGKRIAMLNDVEIEGRGALRAVFAHLNSLKEPPLVKVGVEAPAPRPVIGIDGSVECDGTLSSSRAEVPREVMEEFGEEDTDDVVDVDNVAMPPHQRPPTHVDDGTSPSRPADFLEILNVVQTLNDDPRTLDAAIEKVLPGNCVIIIAEGHNPISSIEIAAAEKKQQIDVQDLGRKVDGRRPTALEVTQRLINALRAGIWLVLLHADKSLSVLRGIESVLQESRDHALEGVHPKSKIIISTAPHPHFPPALVSGSVFLRARHTTSSGTDFVESMHGSMSFVRIIHGGSVPELPGKKKVHICSALQIVDIDSREMFSPSRLTPSRRNFVVSKGVQLSATFEGMPGEKFLCVDRIGELGHVATGTSAGNIYILDEFGDVLHHLHAHEASIWDVCCSSTLDFITGSEDGTAIHWKKSSGEMALEAAQVVQGGADIYAVKFCQDSRSFWVSGTMHSVLRVDSNGKVETFPMSTSGQALTVVHSRHKVVVGGGDGSISIFDALSSAEAVKYHYHQRKVPAVAFSERHGILFSGSFDRTIQAVDMRTSKAHHTLRLKDYVTGLSVDENVLAACVGENMYIWDCRKISEVYGGCSGAWKHLCRGIHVSTTDQSIVTASADGIVRFWYFR